MKKDDKGAMPPEYEYLDTSLLRAQEHVFLINAEIEKLEGNPINESKLVKLQGEKQAIIGNIKQDFEMQTWEDGPIRFEQVEKVIDHQFSDATYQKAKSTLLQSGKDYGKSKYWEDKLKRNLEYYKSLDKENHQIDKSEKFDPARIITYQDWEYDVTVKNPPHPDYDEREIDLEKD